MEPHDPYTPPEALRPLVPPGTPTDVARGWVLDVARRLQRPGAPPLPAEQLAYLRALYDGDIRSWDAELPRLLDGLRRHGVADSTVIVVTADHCEEFLEHGLLLHRAHLFDELIRVPLILAGPGIAAGRRGDQAQGIDVFPTLGALLGLPHPPALPGRDLLAGPADRIAIAETDGQANDGARRALVAARRPDAKLIVAPADGAVARYDLTRDPGERTPLPADASPGLPLRAALDALDRTAAPPPARTGRDPGLRERLRALGYAE
jgi:arylsulfatase A-like enzyme